MTFIRFNPQTAGRIPAARVAELLREFADIHLPLLSAEKTGEHNWSPAVDLRDDKDAFTVTLEAAGMKKEDFEISYHDGVLSISGERRADSVGEGRQYFRRERFTGRFSRSLTMPGEVNPANISASYKDGILAVSLPKAEEAKPKRIEVTVN